MITKYEYLTLKERYKNGYRWIARDGDECVHVYKSKPIKLGPSWGDNEHGRSVWYLNDDSFPYVKCEDEKPTKINDLIRDYESHQEIVGENNLNKAELIKEIEDILDSYVVEKEKLYTVKLANGNCLYRFLSLGIEWMKGYSDYKNDPSCRLTQSEIESVDPVLMQIAEEVAE